MSWGDFYMGKGPETSQGIKAAPGWTSLSYCRNEHAVCDAAGCCLVLVQITASLLFIRMHQTSADENKTVVQMLWDIVIFDFDGIFLAFHDSWISLWDQSEGVRKCSIWRVRFSLPHCLFGGTCARDKKYSHGVNNCSWPREQLFTFVLTVRGAFVTNNKGTTLRSFTSGRKNAAFLHWLLTIKHQQQQQDSASFLQQYTFKFGWLQYSLF